MKERYKRLYNMGLMSAEDIYDIVVYVPAFKLTPLDYEYITGLTWEVDEV